jgi:hypothetical protein
MNGKSSNINVSGNKQTTTLKRDSQYHIKVSGNKQTTMLKRDSQYRLRLPMLDGDECQFKKNHKSRIINF